MSVNEKLFEFISESPTAFHAVATASGMLDHAGFTGLDESKQWDLVPGGKYYITRNGSSLIAFRMPEDGSYPGYMMTSSHSDSPSFKIKENAEEAREGYMRLSIEGYGGMLCAPWFDRPLSVAGRITVRNNMGFSSVNVDLKKPVALIPSVAIHMNRKINDESSYNVARDMQPLFRDEKGSSCSLKKLVSDASGVPESDILSTDLFLYDPEKGVEWGDYISSPRLDDLQCVFSCLTGFLKAKPSDSVPVLCLFDNEEVGNGTRQGAESTILRDTLDRIEDSFHLTRSERNTKIANSFMLSCDNSHAVHPSHPEYKDPNHCPHANRGIVIKLAASQKYTTDAISSSVVKLLCEKADVPYQYYANRADIPGGSTLGNISATKVPVCTADIGLAQFAMHSIFETAGAKDTGYLIKLITLFYEKTARFTPDGMELR